MDQKQIIQEQQEALKTDKPTTIQPKWYVIHIQTGY